MAVTRTYKSKYGLKGGVVIQHPQLNYNPANILSIPLADKFIVPLKYNIGKEAKPCVKVGETVYKGQLIATGGIHAHAPTSGIVTKIDKAHVVDKFPILENCIEIVADHEDKWVELSPVYDYRQHNRADLLNKITQAGIVGLGGSGFPTTTKLQTGKIQTIIVNAAECEPAINADNGLIQNSAVKIIQAIEIVAYIIGADKCYIGIEDDKPEAIASLQKNLDISAIDTDLVICPTKYPSGSEKTLIKLLTGIEVPSKKLPNNIGMISLNVATLVAIYDAIMEGKPLIERITTIYGNKRTQEGNYKIPLGTPISHILKSLHLEEKQIQELIIGGYMMGFNLSNLDAGFIKTINCIIAVENQPVTKSNQALPCIRCGECATVCPIELQPQQLLWHSRAEAFNKLEQNNLFDCIECGACAYVCPSNIPLVQYYRHSKQAIKSQAMQKSKSEISKMRFTDRNARLEKIQAEKQLKRKRKLDNANKNKLADKHNDASRTIADTQSQELSQINIRIEKIQNKIKNLDAFTKKTDKSNIYSQLQAQLQACYVKQQELERK